MPYIIEKNIPMPTERQATAPRGRGRTSRYPLSELSVGDSFFVKNEEISSYNGFRGSIRSTAKNNGISVVTKRYANGVRIWRSE